MIGEIDVRRGDMASALKAFRSARDTTAELLARAPNDPQRIFEHAQSVYWVGYYDWQHGDLPAAENAMLPALRAAGPDAILLADGFSCRTQASQLADQESLHLAELLASRLRVNA